MFRAVWLTVNERSFSIPRVTHEPLKPPRASGEERRDQILRAALTCFGRRGFHLSSMQDISQTAGISVGLIYRYFANKDEVIAAIAGAHLAELRRKLDEAKQMPHLLAALERVLWCEQRDQFSAEVATEPDPVPSFIVDLYAEASRQPYIRQLVGEVNEAVIAGVTALIAESPERAALAPCVTPRHAAELVFQTVHGVMFDEILAGGRCTQSELRTERMATLRRLWSLLFPELGIPQSSVVSR
jgi:AcrR family transcriptional regulator